MRSVRFQDVKGHSHPAYTLSVWNGVQGWWHDGHLYGIKDAENLIAQLQKWVDEKKST